MLLNRFPTVLGFGVCCLLSSVGFAKPGDFEAIQKKTQALQQDFSSLQSNYTVRRGLLGAKESEDIFEKALFYYMMGKYDRSALDLFFLVDSNALEDNSLRYQAQWYLADSAYRLENYTVSRRACMEIIEEGSSHPFFDDSVRLLLEIHGIVGDSRSFQRDFERFILAGQVLPSDKINYSIGKSWYWQGKLAKAKGALYEIDQDSHMYRKAQYVLGGILSEEGDFENALTHFDNVIALQVDSPEEQQILELSLLAKGRLYYETDEFLKAIEAYQQLPGNSQYYPELLYELAWTFIKQEAWDDAARVIDIFLLAFPEHDNAIRLSVIQGDIFLQSQDYEKALVSYDNVLTSLEPVQQSLNQLASDDDAAKSLYTAMLQGDSIPVELPKYALQVLQEEELLRKSIDLNHELSFQGEELSKIRSKIDELKDILELRESLGSFDKGRSELTRLQENCLSVLSEALQLEMNLLESSVSGADRSRIQMIRDQWEAQDEALQSILSVSSQGKEYIRAHRSQIRSVQDVANQVQQVANTLRDGLDKSKSLLQTKSESLNPDEKLLVDSMVNDLEEDLTQIEKGVNEVLSEQTMNTIMATVESKNFNSTQSFDDLYTRMKVIHEQKLLTFWSKSRMNSKGDKKSNIDNIWQTVDGIFTTLPKIKKNIDLAEQKERAIVIGRIESEDKTIATMEDRYTLLDANLDDVGTAAALNGFRLASQQISSNVLRADVGVVKIYWTRKVTNDAEIKELNAQQTEETNELQNKFKYIKSKLNPNLSADEE